MIECDGPLMTLEEAAEYLGVSRSALQSAISRRTLEVIPVSRNLYLVTKDEVDRYWCEHTREGRIAVAAEHGFIPLHEAAAYLGMSRSGVRHAIVSGRLEAGVLGQQYFLEPAEVERFRRERLKRGAGWW